MKKIVLLLAGLTCATVAFPQLFNPATLDKELPCTLISSAGESKVVTATNQHPDLLKKHASNLLTSDGAIHKGLLQAFIIDGHLWALRPTPLGDMWVVMERQGAIESYSYVNSESEAKNKETVIFGSVFRKGTDMLIGIDLALWYKKRMSAMVSDYPELATKVRDGEKGYGALTILNVVDEYNTWYEKNNPGTIKYFPGFFPGEKSKTEEIKGFGDIRDRVRASRDSVEKERKELLASRPAAPDPAIASKKPNIPPKKETFSAKLKRYEAEGHKIAVIIESQVEKVNDAAKDCIEGTKQKTLSDPELVKGLTEKLNQAFQTTLFEAVSINQIPLRGQTGLTINDWWTTHYKTVVSVSDIHSYDPSYSSIDENYDVTLRINLIASVVEYIDDGKNNTDFLKRAYNLGSGYSNAVKYKTSDCPMSMEKFSAMIDPAMALERQAKNQQAQFAKIKEKWD